MVWAAEAGVQFNPSYILHSDTFLKVSWTLAFVGFIGFFIYSFIKYRSIKLTLRHSAWLTIFLLAVTTIFTANYLTAPSSQIQAARNGEPRNITIEQTGTDTLAISWNTDKAVVEVVQYKKEGGTWAIALDEKELKQTTLHLVHLKRLEKGVRYVFEIHYGEKTYTSEHGQPFDFIIY